jgi:hypothetical protein
MTLRQFFRTISLFAFLAICTGCPRNADNTVTVVLDGNPTLTSEIAEHLAASLLDEANWSHISWSQWGLNNTKLTLAPIADPESLRKRVRFGAVTRIDGRTVHVEIDYVRGIVLVLYTRIGMILKETFGIDDDLTPYHRNR